MTIENAMIKKWIDIIQNDLPRGMSIRYGSSGELSCYLITLPDLTPLRRIAALMGPYLKELHYNEGARTVSILVNLQD